MANILKTMLVKRMVYTRIYVASVIMQYIMNCANTGADSDLYGSPNISMAFFNQGIAAGNAIQTAMTLYTLKPTKGNRKNVKNKIVKGKIWVNSYADKVEIIANDDANRNTISEAATNIAFSFLTSRKLVKNKKSKAPTPKIVGKRNGSGSFDVEIINGKSYNPMNTHFILLESSMNATIKIENGEVIIEQEKKGQIRFKSANAKGRYAKFRKLKPGVDYDIYAYSQNGNDNFSELSEKLILKG